ncbi:Purine permease [Thalictrum thalictroides]|uniref:Probable purine permease n=1 Tax=Thalictrum thalictroides TaxID=46969 RepID=A0A7J6XEM3_THATH|nr:Purine permease [Thalictrum thalictroides]
MDSLQYVSSSSSTSNPRKPTTKKYWVLLTITCIALFVGTISSSLLSKFYFIHGGSSRWVSTWVQSAGFPLLLIPIYLPYLFGTFNQNPMPKPFTLLTIKLLLIAIVIGFMVGISNFLFSWSTSYLPISTSSLLLSTHLAFNLIFSVILVKQKLSFFNLNSVILITVSSILLALGSSHDKPKGTTHAQYFLGFFSSLGAGLIFALYLPLLEIVYREVHSYGMVMEMQLVSQTAAQVIAVIGMAVDGGFGEMVIEANVKFDLGDAMYWITIGFTILAWQLSFMGTAGLVYLTKSLTGGVCMTALLPICVLGGVIAFGDKFGGNKAISTLLCFWGFCSYVYGEYIKSKEDKEGLKSNEEMKSLRDDVDGNICNFIA